MHPKVDLFVPTKGKAIKAGAAPHRLQVRAAMAAREPHTPMAGVNHMAKDHQPDVCCPQEPMEKGQGQKVPLFIRLRQALHYWRSTLKAPGEVLQLIQQGVCPDWGHPPSLPIKTQSKSSQEIKNATDLLEDYAQQGAVKKVTWAGTKHLVPWFIISKPEPQGMKHRLIADCRAINAHLNTKHFKLDHIREIFPFLQKGMWATKIDLKDAYFHLALNPTFRPYIRMQVGENLWEFQAACFGLSPLPQLFMTLMKPLQKFWRKRGVQIFVYLDDLLLLSRTKLQVEQHTQLVLQTLKNAGFQVNLKKSQVEASQQVIHLGFLLDVQTGHLKLVPQKLKQIKKQLGKIVCMRSMSCRKMAAILGQIRSCLPALPFLRAFSDKLVSFVNQQISTGWDTQLSIPQELKDQLVNLKELLTQNPGQSFQDNQTQRQHLHSDSSDWGWAGLDLTTGKFVQEFWRKEANLHINVKELKAAVETVRSLAQPNSRVLLSVDNQVIFYYLRKSGGKLPQYNQILRPFLRWCLTNRVHLSIEWVPSKEMMADSLSRLPMDRGDYTLHPPLFQWILKYMSPWINPTVDCFASPGNHQLPQYISRNPHHSALLTDALTCSLESLKEIYANPPWSVVQNWLIRLRDNKHLRCLFICPFWVSIRCWPLSNQLKEPHIPSLLIHSFHGMFLDYQEVAMPPLGGY